ncbi:MAG TPA: transcription-repair coupling factor, partial [Bauldia sp.]|nr:transcription-repair coupling factor [Bauldia sp.]
MSELTSLKTLAERARGLGRAVAAPGTTTLASVPDGLTGKVVADLAREAGRRIVFVGRDGQRLDEVRRTIRFFAPDLPLLDFPAWDCVPYDRVSPHPTVVAKRMATLSALVAPAKGPSVLLTTVNAILQRTPPRAFVEKGSFSAAPGNVIAMDDLVAWLEGNGFLRTATVREPGEYAVRGGILDLYAAGAEAPVRLDFFGDTLETIRAFDAETQRSTVSRPRIDLVPANEMVLSPEAIGKFRVAYVRRF